MGERGGENLYGFVGNDVINEVDAVGNAAIAVDSKKELKDGEIILDWRRFDENLKAITEATYNKALQAGKGNPVVGVFLNDVRYTGTYDEFIALSTYEREKTKEWNVKNSSVKDGELEAIKSKLSELYNTLEPKTYDEIMIIAHGVWELNQGNQGKYSGKVNIAGAKLPDANIEAALGKISTNAKLYACYYSDPEKIHQVQAGLQEATLEYDNVACKITLNTSRAKFEITPIVGFPRVR